jgi:hypothetical protein
MYKGVRAHVTHTPSKWAGLLLSSLLLDVAPPQYQSLTEMTSAIKSGRVQLILASTASPFYQDIQKHNTPVMQLMREVRVSVFA